MGRAIVVSVKLEEDLLEILDLAIKEMRRHIRDINRSDFIRTAIISMLESLKPMLSPELQYRITLYAMGGRNE